MMRRWNGSREAKKLCRSGLIKPHIRLRDCVSEDAGACEDVSEKNHKSVERVVGWLGEGVWSEVRRSFLKLRI